MDLKKKVRGRMEELTRFAYERGYRDGAQSALAEIEKVAGEDVAEQLKGTPVSFQALAKPAAPDGRRRAVVTKQKVQQRRSKPNGAAPKAETVQRCIQRLIASEGEAHRDEVLAAARAKNPEITSQDVHNGIRTLIRRAEIRVDPKEKRRLLPSEPQSAPTPARQDADHSRAADAEDGIRGRAIGPDHQQEQAYAILIAAGDAGGQAGLLKDASATLDDRFRIEEQKSTVATATAAADPKAAGGDEAKRAFDAMMGMKKIDIAAIKAARRG